MAHQPTRFATAQESTPSPSPGIRIIPCALKLATPIAELPGRFLWTPYCPEKLEDDSVEGDGKTMIDVAATGAGPLARPASAGAWLAEHEVVLRLLRGEPVEAVSRQVGVPVWQLERWRARALAGLKPGCASAPRIPLSASWPRPIGGSVSFPWRSSCSAPASSAPALWPAGGRADGRRELPSYR